MLHFIPVLAASLYAIIGGPCVGKTSIINELETLGEITCRESATDVIAEYQDRGIVHPWELPGFETVIYQEKVAREQRAISIAKSMDRRKVFTDRGLLDTLVYLEVNNKLDTDEYTSVTSHLSTLTLPEHYKIAFFVEPYSGSEFIADDTGIRHEDSTEAIRLGIEVKKVYKEAGIPLIIVPPYMTPKERAKFILQKLSEFEATQCNAL